MKTKKTHFTIHVVGKNCEETVQVEALILKQFEYKGRLWIVHNSYNTRHSFDDDWFAVSDYITGLGIDDSYHILEHAIFEAKKTLRPYTYAQVDEHIKNSVEKYEITKFNEI